MGKPKLKTPPLKRPASVLGLKTFAAISAVEGLKLSSPGRKRVMQPLPTAKRRANVIKAYLDLKGRR